MNSFGQASPLPGGAPHPADVAAASGAPPDLVAQLRQLPPDVAQQALDEMSRGVDPAAGQIPPGGMPMQAGMPFPSTDPNSMAQIVAQAIAAAQSADQQGLAAEQDMAAQQAMVHPIVQSMMQPPAAPDPMRGMSGGAFPMNPQGM